MGDYLKKANQNVFIAVQIETVEGLENCEEIAKVEGIGESPFLRPLVAGIGIVAWWRWHSVDSDVERFADMRSFGSSFWLDMLFVGPNDLCSSMGFPALEHPNIPEVQSAIERVLKAAHDAGKYAGMFCTAADQVQKRFEQGCTCSCLLISFDLALLSMISFRHDLTHISFSRSFRAPIDHRNNEQSTS